VKNLGHPVDELPEEEKRIWDLLDEVQDLIFSLRVKAQEWNTGERRLKNTETLVFAAMDILCPESRCGCLGCERFHEDIEEVLFRKYWSI
jgi:hypothetical protein